MTTPRARARVQTMTDIKRIAREHLATDGAAALSLRAVARDLGVVSSAVYRYVRSRDELLTLLVVDGYDALGDAVEAAIAATPDDPIEQLRITARTVRAWALAEPAWYGLLFGTPVPGYAAPADRTVTPGTRVIVTLMQLFDAAHRRGLLMPPAANLLPLSGPLAGDFVRIRAEFGLDVPDWLLARGLTVWCALFGAVSFDVFDMYGADTFADREQVFETHIAALETLLGAT
ncbi:TetR/AcrR family transcriptional regulator [Nocardia jinanensis]|uniref:TetR family transcriptional regulator n=1 Tax=Nocardia jinanensis TaxID=382504 RepID=A0A917RB28_9NOCA|nr:TetR/AcrR family transcriptional regulator [Nocardia jinanensis]GGK98141.1 TetR family transcriptional regulator [Nocardia jinanensis]